LSKYAKNVDFLICFCELLRTLFR